MKTLYLTDLDGTLLHSDKSLSNYTVGVINKLLSAGEILSYATARSISSASKLTAKINSSFPVICCNGAFIFDNGTHEMLLSNYFNDIELEKAVKIFSERKFSPIVNAYIDGIEKFSYIETCLTEEAKQFLNQREGDHRARKVDNEKELFSGKIFRFTCLGSESSIRELSSPFQATLPFSCIIQKELYIDSYSCEVMPAKATKANAALQLKSLMKCDRIVAFGDGENDIPLFSVADKRCAVGNAVHTLKELSDEIIESNNNDGVAKWLDSAAGNLQWQNRLPRSSGQT